MVIMHTVLFIFFVRISITRDQSSTARLDGVNNCRSNSTNKYEGDCVYTHICTHIYIFYEGPMSPFPTDILYGPFTNIVTVSALPNCMACKQLILLGPCMICPLDFF
jgi:hypothetical protein